MFELYLFATVISLFLALGLNVVISHNPVYSILYLVLFFVTGASILVLFGFDYLSLIFVLVYVGAIAVLFLFVVMILDIKIINKSGFDATFLVLLSLLLFVLPLVYQFSSFILLINRLNFEFFFGFYIGIREFCNNAIALLGSDLVVMLNDSKFFFESFNIYYNFFVVLENYLSNLELQVYYSMGFYDYFILLKHIFCKYGFVAPESEILLYDSFNTLKIDYDSSVKNFQILYTDFTSLFIICGGVLLIAMTSCISLALPSRQVILNRHIRRRFQY